MTGERSQEPTKNSVFIVLIIVVGAIILFTILIFFHPCAKASFKIDPPSSIEGTWEPLPLWECGGNVPSTLTNEEIMNILKEKAKLQNQTALLQTKEAELQSLQNDTNKLQLLSKVDPAVVPVLVTKLIAINETKSELGSIRMELSSQQITFMKTLGNVSVITTSDNQKNQVSSEIKKINFPSIELDQKIYTWTDRVYVTIISPYDNKDPNTLESIGITKGRDIVISTHNSTLNYSLTESSYDTGIFTGYIILSGNASINVGDNQEPKHTKGYTGGFGPTDGFITATPEDKITVSYHYAPGITVTGSALIKWNIGEIRWLGTNYTSKGQGEVQIIDPDMNLDPKIDDTFKIFVFSNSEPQGTKITMTEIGPDTGIFRGMVHFTNSQPSYGDLKVSEGDAVTAVYVDRTLPSPYHIGDSLKLTAVQEIQYENPSFNETTTYHIGKGKN